MQLMAVEGTLELELQPRPLALAGQFHVGAAEASETRVNLARLVIGAVLVAPAAVALVAGVLRAELGFAPLFDTVSNTPILSAIIVASLFVGAPIALLINLLPILRLSWSRHDGKISTTLALKPDLLQLVVLIVALGVVGVFVGHLIADEFACLNGVKSAC